MTYLPLPAVAFFAYKIFDCVKYQNKVLKGIFWGIPLFLTCVARVNIAGNLKTLIEDIWLEENG